MDVSCVFRIILISLVFLIAARSTFAAVSDEERLQKYLIENYGQAVRPVSNRSRPIVINATVYFIKLIGLREKEQEYEYAATLNLVWLDPKLKWNASEFGGYDDTVISTKALPMWLPDISLYNGVDMGEDFDYSTKGHYKMLIKSRGKVVWTFGTVFKTICLMDITYFPFDRQVCETRFISQTRGKGNLVLQPATPYILTDSPPDTGEWAFIWNGSRAGLTNRVMYNGRNLQKSDFRVTVVLDRKYLFYMINTIAPCWIMSLLVLMVYCLPAAAPEKVSLSMTILLTFSVFQLIVADSLPRSAGISIFGLYLLLQMILSCASVIMAVFSLNIIGRDLPLPSRIRSFVFSRLARLLCKEHLVREMDTYHGEEHSAAETEVEIYEQEPETDVAERDVSANPNWAEPILESTLERVASLLDFAYEVDEKQRKLDQIRLERNVLVSVTDRLLLMLSATLLALITVICFSLLFGRGEYMPEGDLNVML
ncbi:neuronal acetylcholine receptor subunit alpha-3-like isoform X1 [Lineus longissimus]|uniref:neuronal acetylcholine receptor subunit alpha-3-like isoform X1 n=1 Tax=Lineus longissimus TaxID=88925 RepID=UPI00315DE887